MHKHVFLFLLLVSAVYAQNYYADVTVDVKDDGSATITGLTNHPLLNGTSQEFTSKKGMFWTLNITLPDEFETYVIKVTLPTGSILNYVHGKGVSIASSDSKVTVTQIGEHTPIAFVAQYQITSQQQQTQWIVTALAIVATLVLFTLVMLLGYWGQKRRSKKALPEHYKGLPPRQREIVEMVHKAGGKLTQKQIEAAMSIPKSSVSRNIDGLVRKGIVEKESLGLANIVKLK